jgi:hypothetical protein
MSQFNKSEVYPTNNLTEKEKKIVDHYQKIMRNQAFQIAARWYKYPRGLHTSDLIPKIPTILEAEYMPNGHAYTAEDLEKEIILTEQMNELVYGSPTFKHSALTQAGRLQLARMRGEQHELQTKPTKPGAKEDAGKTKRAAAKPKTNKTKH